MGTVRGLSGELESAQNIFQRVACMKIVLINCIWIGSGFGILFKFAHLVGKELICIYILE